MTVPACKKEGMHLDGDESLCTLEAFKRVVDGFHAEELEGPMWNESRREGQRSRPRFEGMGWRDRGWMLISG